jgi:hypothetical protein
MGLVSFNGFSGAAAPEKPFLGAKATSWKSA